MIFSRIRPPRAQCGVQMKPAVVVIYVCIILHTALYEVLYTRIQCCIHVILEYYTTVCSEWAVMHIPFIIQRRYQFDKQ